MIVMLHDIGFRKLLTKAIKRLKRSLRKCRPLYVKVTNNVGTHERVPTFSYLRFL